MDRLMRCRALLLLLFVAGGCHRVDNTFEITDPGRIVTSAEIRVCGAPAALARVGDRLIGAQPATCEGEGHVLVRLADGDETTCRVGYVTSGLAQRFEFTVEDSLCTPTRQERTLDSVPTSPRD
jgi:hypothetical protein